MGELRPVKPVAMLAAVFSADVSAREWARERLAQQWGPIALSSDPFPFVQTDYYEREMGTELQKQFHLLHGLADPAALADWKLRTNDWEQEFAARGGGVEQAAAGGARALPRAVNIDPGYLTEAKLVLATTKDRDHRIYLRDGIFAEVTLFYRAGQWCGRPWTYPDYELPGTVEFLTTCRQQLRAWQRRPSDPAPDA